MIVDRILAPRLRPPRLGTIGLGIKVNRGEKEYPQEVHYFVVPEEVGRVHGDKPTTIPVRFPFNEPEQNLHSIYFTERAGKSKVRQCDGERYVKIQRGGKDETGACPRDRDNPYAQCPHKCRATARLAVIVERTRLGIWEIRIGGLQRIVDLLGELRLYRAAVGPLSQFPFLLERVKTEEQYFNERGEMQHRAGHPVRLRCPYTVEEVARLQGRRGVQVAFPIVHEEDILDEEDDEAPAAEPEVLPAGQKSPSPREGVMPDPADTPAVDAHPTAAPVVTPPAGAPSPAARPTQPAPAVSDDPWEECYQLAAKLDIDRETYGGYVRAVYGEQVGLGDVLDAIGALQAADQNPATRAAFKAAARAAAAKARKGA